MQKIFKIFALCSLLFVLWDANAALDLTGTVDITKSGDTVTAAKNAAFDDARRQVISKVLSRYSDANALEKSLKKTPNSELVDMVATSSISDEKTSATDYHANFTIVLDRAAATKWMANKNIPNYMAAADDSGNRATMFFRLNGGLRQWSALMQSLRETGLDKNIELQTMQGQNVSVTVPVAFKTEYINALQSLGWKITNSGGITRVFR